MKKNKLILDEWVYAGTIHEQQYLMLVSVDGTSLAIVAPRLRLTNTTLIERKHFKSVDFEVHGTFLAFTEENYYATQTLAMRAYLSLTPYDIVYEGERIPSSNQYITLRGDFFLHLLQQLVDKREGVMVF